MRRSRRTYLLHASRLKTQELVVDTDQVVRARISSDEPMRDVAIHHIEGGVFFGAAPDLRSFLRKIGDDAKSNGVKAMVLRLKRVRNPDAVALEILDNFLKDAKASGLIVFLAGVRPELGQRSNVSASSSASAAPSFFPSSRRTIRRRSMPYVRPMPR